MASVRQVSSFAVTSSGTAIAPSWPAATLAGSTLAAVIFSRNEDEVPAWTPPSGWTLGRTAEDTGGGDCPESRIYYIEESAARSGSESFSHDGSAKPLGGMLIEIEPGSGEVVVFNATYSAELFTAAGGTNARDTGTTPTTPGGFVAVGGSASRNASRNYSSIKNSYTERANGDAGSGFTGMQCGIGTLASASSAATGTGWTINNTTNSQGTGVVVAFLIEESSADQEVDTSAIVHTRAFGTTTLQRGNVDLSPSGLVHTRAFGTAELLTVYEIDASSVVSTRAFGTARIDQDVVVSSVVQTRAFGTPSLDKFITPSSVVHTRGFGTPRIDLQITPGAVVSARAFGDVTTTFGGVEVSPSSVVHTRAFGTPIVASEGGDQQINHNAVVATRAFGTAQLDLDITPSSVVATRAFGALEVGFEVEVVSVVHGRAIGDASLLAEYDISTSSVVNARAIGDHTLTQEYNVLINSVVSARAFGSPTLEVGNVDVLPPTVAHVRGFGTATIEGGEPPVSINIDSYGRFSQYDTFKEPLFRR